MRCMKLLRNKLNSNRGASLILALSFFLICAVIGGIILASASTNAGRVNAMRQEQEAYYAVSAAAVLVRDCVEDMHFSAYEETIEETRDIDYTLPEGELSQFIGALAKEVYETGSAVSEQFEMTAADMPDVTMTMDMDALYHITATFQLRESAGQYVMQLKIPAALERYSYLDIRVDETVPEEDEEQAEVEVLISSAAVVWSLGEISKGGGA